MFGFNDNKERIIELEHQLVIVRQDIGNLRREVKDLKSLIKQLTPSPTLPVASKKSERTSTTDTSSNTAVHSSSSDFPTGMVVGAVLANMTSSSDRSWSDSSSSSSYSDSGSSSSSVSGSSF